MQGRIYRLAVLFLFVFSGACGLIYQIVWTKDLYLIMGVTVYAISTVLSSFMAGLALGSYLFGRIADKIKSPLGLYALLEAGIGIFALIVPFLFSWISDIYVSLHDPTAESGFLAALLRLVLCFFSLLIPTTLMGGTLPVLAKFFVEREKTIGLGVGLLYSINTLGAVLGCFCTGFLLIPSFGISGTTYMAVVINFLVAVLALILARAAKDRAQTHKSKSIEEPKRIYSRMVVLTVFWVIGVSGFTSLSYEILWTRVLVYFIGQSTYAFTTMLTTFLVGIALGSFIVARFTDRLKDPVTFLGIIEALLGLAALFAIVLIGAMFDIWDYFKEVLKGYPDWIRGSWWVHMGVRFLLAFIFMLIPTLLMGAAFPVAAKIYAEGLGTLGKRVGNIYSINTLCAIFGSLTTGFLLIPALGVQRCLVIMVLLNLGLGIVLFLVSPKASKVFKGILTLGALAGVLFSLSFYEDRPVVYSSDLVTKTFVNQKFNAIYCNEGIDASLVVLEEEKTKERQLNINGTSTAYTSINDLQVHRLLAHIPMAIHKNPKKVLVIGFGFGSSSYGATLYGADRVDCAELVEDEINTAPFFAEQNHDVINKNPKFHFYAEDGRNFALTSKTKYDVLSVNAIHPSLAPNLYTLDFYKICRNILEPNGLVCVWLPTTMLATEEFRILLRTFSDQFPASTFWYNNPANVILLGAVEPFKIDFKHFCAQLERPGVKEDLESVYLSNPYSFLNLLIFSPDYLLKYVDGAALNTDDFPCIEFTRSQYAGFREDMLLDIFFTEKSDLPSLLTSYGDTEQEQKATALKFEKHQRAWPFMTEGHLITFVKASKEEKAVARKCLSIAWRHAPDDCFFHYLMTHFGIQTNIHEWKIESLLEEVNSPSGGTDAQRYALARLYLESGKGQDAYQLFNTISNGKFQEDSAYHLSRALAVETAGKAEEAVRLLKQIMSKWPELSLAYEQCARLMLIHHTLFSMDEAEALARKAVALDPSAFNYDLLGMILFQKGRMKEAEEMVSLALSKPGIVHYVYKFHLFQIRKKKP